MKTQPNKFTSEVEIFNYLTANKDKDDIVARIQAYLSKGKSLDRAMADVLEDLHLDGAI